VRLATNSSPVNVLRSQKSARPMVQLFTLSLSMGVFWDGTSSTLEVTVTPLWLLGRHFLVCGSRVYHERGESEGAFWAGETLILRVTKSNCVHHCIPTDYDFDSKFTDVFTRFPCSLLLYMFEQLQSVPANICSTDFKLEMAFCYRYMVYISVYSPSQTQTPRNTILEKD
jgi:hypothetical protein